MVIGKVVGTVVSSRKHDEMQGLKLLVVKRLHGNTDERFVAADTIGAGCGELVLVTMGNAARRGLPKDAPVDAVVVGIVDGEPTLAE